MITNALFAELTADWSCPACSRARTQIPRVSSTGAEVAKAVIHHDHIKEYTNALMREKFGSDWVAKVPAGIGEHLNRIERFVVGFAPTVVCEDCNNAEGRAKQIAGAPKFFTFAPSEVRRFISVAPNRKHEVDAALVAAVYSESKARYTIRIAVAKHLNEEALAGNFWITLR